MNRGNGFKLGSVCKGVLAVSGHRYDPLSLALGVHGHTTMAGDTPQYVLDNHIC
jgi:hypothetical protein